MLLVLWTVAAWALPPEDAAWTVQQDGEIRVECTTVGDEPWCRAETTHALPLAAIAAAIEDRESFPKYFPHVSEVRMLDERTHYLRIDLPSPMTDRDQVSRADRIDEDGVRYYRWVSVEHEAAPPTDALRLTGAAGEWRLEPTPSGGTKMRYTWQGAMGGSFPGWLLGRAWVSHGNETITGTIEAAKDLAAAN